MIINQEREDEYKSKSVYKGILTFLISMEVDPNNAAQATEYVRADVCKV